MKRFINRVLLLIAVLWSELMTAEPVKELSRRTEEFFGRYNNYEISWEDIPAECKGFREHQKAMMKIPLWLHVVGGIFATNYLFYKALWVPMLQFPLDRIEILTYAL